MNIREAKIRIKQIENDIELEPSEELEEQKTKLENWVEREIQIIKEYDPIKAKVIILRDESNLTWEQIAEATNYSKKQCYNIYNAYTQKRYK